MPWFATKFADKSVAFKRPADEALLQNQVDNNDTLHIDSRVIKELGEIYETVVCLYTNGKEKKNAIAWAELIDKTTTWNFKEVVTYMY